MTISPILYGSAANDGTGDTLRSAAIKINANFAALDGDMTARFGGFVAPGSITLTRISANATTITAGGVNEPQANTIQQLVGADASAARTALDAYGGVPTIMVRRAQGTLASPSALTSGLTIGQFSVGGFGSTAFTGGRAALVAFASEAWSDSAQGTYWTVQVTATGSTSQTSIGRITSVGWNLGNNSDPTSTLTVIGSIATQPQAANITASTYSVIATDADLVFAASGTCTVTLPAAASFPGRVLWLNTETAQAVVSASANVIPRAGGAAGTAILAASAGSWARLKSNGTAWKIMAGA